MTTFKPDPRKPLAFFQQLPNYRAKPTINLQMPLGVELIIKHEGERLGLGSFKGLGGIYAVAQLISEQWERRHGESLALSELRTKRVRDMASSLCFVCASAGNHGLAVSAGARLLGAVARVYLSQSVPQHFEQRLIKQGAEVIREGATYEESMAAAMANADSTGAILLADSSWLGYTYPPSLIMEGYTIIAEELNQEFEQSHNWPTDVYLQAGVGGFAAAMTYMIRHHWPVQPHIYIVEPEYAPCLNVSHKAGKPVSADGPISSMGRLDCKEPSLLAFKVLQNSQVNYMTISEKEAGHASHHLKKYGVETTPSGAAGFAAFIKNKPLGSTASDRLFKPMIFITENINNS